MSVNKKNVVKGEPVILSIKLLAKTNISGVEDIKFPTFDGFWSQEIESPTNLSFVRETYKGQIYDAALLRKYVLLPQQTGVVSIDPSEMVCLVQIRNNSPSRSPFDDFFDNYQTLRKRIHSQKLELNVSPLPAGAPSSFTGGVGEYKMDVKLSRDTLKAHEAASLIVTITGTGNINLIEAPKIDLPPDFEAYDVKRSDKIASGTYGSTGTKTFEYPFIPRSSGSFEIAPVNYSYYSISQGKYVTITSKPLKIGVARGEESTATVIAGGVNKQSVKSLGEDIRFISTNGASLKKGESFIVVSYPFGLSIGFIALLFIAVCYILDKTNKRRRDVAGTRNRKAKKVAKARLKKAEIFLKQNLYSAFYEELHKAILGLCFQISLQFLLLNLIVIILLKNLEKKGRRMGLLMNFMKLLMLVNMLDMPPLQVFQRWKIIINRLLRLFLKLKVNGYEKDIFIYRLIYGLHLCLWG